MIHCDSQWLFYSDSDADCSLIPKKTIKYNKTVVDRFDPYTYNICIWFFSLTIDSFWKSVVTFQRTGRLVVSTVHPVTEGAGRGRADHYLLSPHTQRQTFRHVRPRVHRVARDVCVPGSGWGHRAVPTDRQPHLPDHLQPCWLQWVLMFLRGNTLTGLWRYNSVILELSAP